LVVVSGHEKALLKLLKVSGYELTDENAFGFCTYSRLGHTDVLVMPGIPSRQAANLTTQIRRERAREKRTEETPEAILKQREWDASERERTAREAADRALVADTRLGGLSAVLTEDEVEAIVDRAERRAADRRALTRLMRERPLAYAN
jgi:hypothetical protein